MDNSKIIKLENPLRIKELNPNKTLIKAGFKKDMVLCDIGAGSGIFSFAATQLTQNDVYALEISDSMIELLEKRKNERKTQNLKIKKVNSFTLPLNSNICDMAIMITVIHEIEDKYSILNEIKKILKVKGKLLIIEFHKKKTPMGPPVNHRISEEFLEEICSNKGFKIIDKFSLGENFYGILFES